MSPSIALTLCVILVIGLLRVESKRNDEVSFALWIPTLWVLIGGSRPIGRWFVANRTEVIGSLEEGSSLDRLVLSILLLVGLFILFRRKMDWSGIFKDNIWLILLFGYLGVSILWTDIPFVAFKRWTRASEDIVMALVVLSERKPLEALASVLRRCAYVLIPVSLVLIKYFPDIGRAYSRWSGMEMWTGVALHKNTLGQLCALSALVLIWSLFCQYREDAGQKTKSRIYADAIVLLLAGYLLLGSGESASSATSLAVLIVGVGMLVLVYKGGSLSRYMVRNLKAVTVVLALLYLAFYDLVIKLGTSMLGRDETLTGRTEMWAPLLDYASNQPIFGVGYGGFGDAGGNQELLYQFGETMALAQAHNGYLAVYVETGIVGLGFLCLFLLAYCDRVRRELDHSFEWGALGLCLLPLTLLYNNSEASFLQNGSYLWSVIILFTVVFSDSGLRVSGVDETSKI